MEGFQCLQDCDEEEIFVRKPILRMCSGIVHHLKASNHMCAFPAIATCLLKLTDIFPKESCWPVVVIVL